MRVLTYEEALDLLTSCESHVKGLMVPVPKLRALAREWCGKADEASLDATAGHVLLALAKECVRLRARYRWRPIEEIHEDYSLCVLIDIHDPGGAEVGSNLDTDYDESQWTHFAQLPELTNDEAERLISSSTQKIPKVNH